MTPSLRFSLAASLLLAASACSSDPAETTGGAGGSGASASGGAAGGSSAPQTCPPGPGRETPADARFVEDVSARIVDGDGEPTSSGLVQICGKNLCINADVPDSGVLAETVNDEFDAPALKYGDGKQWGKLAVGLGDGTSELGTLVAVRLPDFEQGVELRAGATATSDDVTLELASDAVVQFDTLTYEDESQLSFRAARLPSAAIDALGQDFAVVYTLAPVETHLCPGASVSLSNSAELEPGTEVELFMLGLDVLEEWAGYGQWQKVSDGVVSEDGASIAFDDPLPVLTTIGVRVKP